MWGEKVSSIGIVSAAALASAAFATPAPAAAQTSSQDQPHVVSLDELNRDRARPAETRQAEETAVRDLLTTTEGQEALKRAKIDYQRVDNAVGQLSDEDLARVAARSREAQADFAAGAIGRKLLIVIILIIVLAIALSVAF
jgi:hypothetical protein